MRLPLIVLACVLALAPGARAQEGATQTREVSADDLRAAIDRLSTIDFAVRMEAARTIRRAPAATAVPLLSAAATGHADGYVRYRALILLSGFNDPRTRDVMTRVMADKNDRLRAVAYAFFEHNQDPAILPRLLDALATEEGEFVRPALTRTLAAYGKDPRAHKEVVGLVMRGQDFFRSAVIEAVGDYKVTYAFDVVNRVAQLDGPLQDDAVLALGKLGDKRAVQTLASLQQSAPRAVQPAIATSICLLGVNCSSHLGYLVETLKFSVTNPGFQDLLRSTANGLATLAIAGNEEALKTLADVGGPSRDPARAAIALAVGTVALRDTDAILAAVERGGAASEALQELLREAFDMLEEDYMEERFYVAVRRGYWRAAAGSPARKAAEALIRKLEF